MKKKVEIKGYVARCEDGALALYCYANRFYRRTGDENNGYWESDTGIMMLVDRRLFPALKWEDEPRKVKITIETIE